MNSDLLSEFTARKFEIDYVLQALRDLSDNHFGASPETLNWSHVGSLTEIAKQLHTVLQFAKVD